MSEDSKKVKVNKALQEKLEIAGIPENLLPVLLGFGIIAIFIQGIIGTSWKVGLFLFLAPSLTYIFLVGKKPETFIERFHTPRRWISGDYIVTYAQNHPLPLTRKRENILIVNLWPKVSQVASRKSASRHSSI